MSWNKCGILIVNQNQADRGRRFEKKKKKQVEAENKCCVRVQFVCVGTTGFACGRHGDCSSPCLRACYVSVSLPPFVGRPSHLFHGYICDLQGSDWYGNIIIQARILSLPSLALSPLSPSLLSLSPPTNFLSRVSTLAVSPFRIAPSLTSNTSDSSLLLSFCCLTQLSQHFLMPLYFFLQCGDPLGGAEPCWASTLPTGRKMKCES